MERACVSVRVCVSVGLGVCRVWNIVPTDSESASIRMSAVLNIPTIFDSFHLRFISRNEA